MDALKKGKDAIGEDELKRREKEARGALAAFFVVACRLASGVPIKAATAVV